MEINIAQQKHRDIRPITNWLVRIIWAFVSVQAFRLLVFMDMLFNTRGAGSHGGNPFVGRVDLYAYLLSALLVLTFVILTTVWMVKISRMVKRRALGEIVLNPGWAAGSFYVPVVNFVAPAMMLTDIWNTATSNVYGNEKRAWHQQPKALIAWKLLWPLMLLVLNPVAERSVRRAFFGMGMHPILSMVLIKLLVILTAAFFAMTVRKLADRVHEMKTQEF